MLSRIILDKHSIELCVVGHEQRQLWTADLDDDSEYLLARDAFYVLEENFDAGRIFELGTDLVTRFQQHYVAHPCMPQRPVHAWALCPVCENKTFFRIEFDGSLVKSFECLSI